MAFLNTSVAQNGLTGVFISDLVLQILAYVAETERDQILQRQREGIEAAKKPGIQFGRPKKEVTDAFHAACREYADGALTTREAARMVGLSTSTFYRRYRERMSGEEEQECFKG